MSIFTVPIFNIYGHQIVGRNVDVTYILQYNHPEGSVENFGEKNLYSCFHIERRWYNSLQRIKIKYLLDCGTGCKSIRDMKVYWAPGIRYN